MADTSNRILVSFLARARILKLPLFQLVLRRLDLIPTAVVTAKDESGRREPFVVSLGLAETL